MQMRWQVASRGAAESGTFSSLAAPPLRLLKPGTFGSGDPLWHYLDTEVAGCSVSNYRKNTLVYAQGEPADAVFIVMEGWVKLAAVSAHGKQAVLTVLGVGDVLGDTCVLDEPVRSSSATALEWSTLFRIEKQDLPHILRRQPRFAEGFLRHLLFQKDRLEQGLINQIFHSSEKRLASILLALAARGMGRIPRINQETLAAMVGTTRSRISFFMNKLKRHGYIRYEDGIYVDAAALQAFIESD